MCRSFICVMLQSTSDQSTGYGGAVSVNFGLSAGLKLLQVSSFDLVLENSTVTNCYAGVWSAAGNAYGGGISVYVGGYSWAELVVTAYSSLGLCICVSADGGMSPNSCFFHLLEGMDWGADCHQWNNDARHNNPSSGGSAKDLTTLRPCQPLGAFKFLAGHVPYNHHFNLQTILVPPPPRKPAGTNTQCGRRRGGRARRRRRGAECRGKIKFKMK
jgi:hypothetical protein